MTESRLTTPKRLLRILIGGAVLATAWVAFDTLTHSEAASAAEIRDVPSISDVTSSGSATASKLVSPVIERVISFADQVSQVSTNSVSTSVSTLEQVMSNVVSTSVAIVAPVVETLAAPLVPVVADVVDALPALPQLPTIPSLGVPSAGLLLSGGALVFGVALAASTIPLLPTPAGGVPRDPPAVPSSFDGAAAILSFVHFSPPGSALTLRAIGGGMPASPTYGFDTTPD
jgi:hypothetical protein